MHIFINYRREDSSSATGRIDDHLRREFGEDAVFRDIDSIPLGSDFVEHIEQAIGAASVVVVVIGPGWVTARLHNENDFVRLEVEAALKLSIPVIPVLVEDARLPSAHEVPASLAPLLRRNGLQIDSGRDFRSHLRLLTEGIKRVQAAKLAQQLTALEEAKRAEEQAAASMEQERLAAAALAEKEEGAKQQQERDAAQRALDELLNVEQEHAAAQRARAAKHAADLAETRAEEEAVKRAHEQAAARYAEEEAEMRAQGTIEARRTHPVFAEPPTTPSDVADVRILEDEVQRAASDDGKGNSSIAPTTTVAGARGRRINPAELMGGLSIVALLGLSIVNAVRDEEADDEDVYRALATTMQIDSEPTPHLTELTLNGLVELVSIPGGTFTMGSPAEETGRYSDEGPQHQVKLSPFFVGKYEVTHAQFDRFLAANPTVVRPPGYETGADGDRPVENVSWEVAWRFAKWDDARLPTEAEWEYAARAGTVGRRYGRLDEIAWYGADRTDEVHAAGKLKPNAFGLYDMLGNVAEHCADAWTSHYEPTPVVNPKIPATDSYRIVRGGSLYSNERAVRAAARSISSSNLAYRGYGFRIARDFSAKRQ